MKKRNYLIFITLFCSMMLMVGCDWNKGAQKLVNEIKNEANTVINETQNSEKQNPFKYLEKTYNEGESYITSKNQIELRDSDGKGQKYTFKYNNEKYTALYTKDNWHIDNSYKIRNKKDITLICAALIDKHPIHSSDKKSYRTAEDMMYEWIEHNIAYDYLPDGNEWKNHAKDVDLNPADQGKSLEEMYEMRLYK